MTFERSASRLQNISVDVHYLTFNFGFPGGNR